MHFAGGRCLLAPYGPGCLDQVIFASGYTYDAGGFSVTDNVGDGGFDAGAIGRVGILLPRIVGAGPVDIVQGTWCGPARLLPPLRFRMVHQNHEDEKNPQGFFDCNRRKAFGSSSASPCIP